jgi:hypothetical protein
MGLDAPPAELPGQVGDRRHEEQERSGGLADHGRERSFAPSEGRPEDPGQGNDRRQEGRDADGDVDRPTRPIGEEDDAGSDRPAGREDEGDQPQLEGPNTHGGQSTRDPYVDCRRQ